MHHFRVSAAIACLTLVTTAGAQQGADRLADRFVELDKNADGALTPNEFPRERLFAIFDADSDGRITLEEARQQATGLRERLRSQDPARGEAPPAADLFVRSDLAYTDDAAHPRLMLDIYAPKEPITTLRPIMIMIHGGGWAIGDKASRGVVNPKAQWFVQRGYLFVSINYRLTPEVVHPVHAEDCASAIAWLHEHAGEFGGDPARIAVIGHSAGAHLAALISTDGSYLRAHGLPLSTIEATILLDGAGYDIPKTMADARSPVLRNMYTAAFTDDERVWAHASPVNHVKAGQLTPPFLLLHAGQRAESRMRSEELAEALREAGVDAVVSHQPAKTHATINADLGVESDSVTLAVAAFLESHTEPVKPSLTPGQAEQSP